VFVLTQWQQRWVALYRERKGVRWAVDLALLLIAVAVIGAWQTRGHLRGGPVPSFELASLDGRTVSSQSLRGQPVMLAFWAPWCGVCKSTSDNVERVADLMGSRAKVVSVALAYDSRASVESYAREHAMTHGVWLGTEQLGREMHVEAFPTFYFLDAEGRVAGSAVGYTTTLGLLWRLWWA
jgi:thiol-disulfide isomerase/thioredoxin